TKEWSGTGFIISLICGNVSLFWIKLKKVELTQIERGIRKRLLLKRKEQDRHKYIIKSNPV
ncbi:hypothetical protein C5167_040322, partial [Papaver somniferum]